MTTSLTASTATRSRSIRALTLGIALVAAGLVVPAATLADGAPFDPPTANERSITLTESKEPAAFVPMTQNRLSIMLIESKEAPGGVLADGQPDFALTANERSIAKIEGKEAPGGVLVITP